MTQQAVERALGKLLTDENFRERFFTNAEIASWEPGFSSVKVSTDESADTPSTPRDWAVSRHAFRGVSGSIWWSTG